jgi:hypothetical protein
MVLGPDVILDAYCPTSKPFARVTQSDLDHQGFAGGHRIGDASLKVHTPKCLGRKTPVQQQRPAQHAGDDQQQIRFEKNSQTKRERQQKQVMISFTTNCRTAAD